jgi:hypothetical protein
MDLREVGCEGVDWISDSGYEQLTGSYGIKPSGSIESGELVDQLSDY